MDIRIILLTGLETIREVLKVRTTKKLPDPAKKID
jgi:hypothetical protein